MFAYLPTWLLRPALWLADKWPWLHAVLNSYIIDSTVKVCRNRPHPWSTAHDYVSWTSLTDQRWSARHLPVDDRVRRLPSEQALAELFRRPDGKQRDCHKSTCLFPAFAQYLTDGFIRTRMPEANESERLRLRNSSNHQIDLCPLYGLNAAQTKQLRRPGEDPQDRGRLKSCIRNGEELAPALCEGGVVKKEFDALCQPLGFDKIQGPEYAHIRDGLFAFGGDRANAVPSVAAINTLFLREHNRLAGEIVALHPEWDSDRVFETARATTIVLFIKIVVEDYINHIAPLPFRLKADASVAWAASWNRPNWITTEFSLLYRWHSLVPDTMRLGGSNFAVRDLRFNNEPLRALGLARILADLSAQPAGALGNQNTTADLVDVEQRAIAQGRLARLKPYSDYREYVHLDRPRRFEDINPDPAVAETLASLYDSVDDVDFYVGMFLEPTVPNSPLPRLILTMVAVDAFSQALTNPLLSEHVYNKDTFSEVGWNAIQTTSNLDQIVRRNTARPDQIGPVTMTRSDWAHRW